jgi:hypothetical protein
MRGLTTRLPRALHAQTAASCRVVMLAKTVSYPRAQQRGNWVRIHGSREACGKEVPDHTNRGSPGKARTIPHSPDPAGCGTLPALQGIADAESRFGGISGSRRRLAHGSWRQAGD